MADAHGTGRRNFLRSAAIGSAALTIPVYLQGCGAKETQPGADAPFAPNAWVRLGTDGQVTLVVDRSEMGQGVATALPMLVAEELDADWGAMQVEQAPANAVYDNAAFAGNQVTGGSASVFAAWTPLREAGAKARAMLVAAAASQWGVAPSSCRTDGGFVQHPESGRKASYGELAQAAAKLPVPDKVTLKAPGDFKLIGKPIPRLDTPDKVAGRAQFGMDVRLPDMLTAVVARCPVFGGKPARFDATKSKQVPGVRDVIAISTGVAVIADAYWPASRGREALEIEWDEGPARAVSTDMLRDQFSSRASADAAVAREIGDVETAKADAAIPVEAEYELPFLAHATMEPQNCTADVRKDRCVIWAPTQFQTGDPMFAGGGARGVAMKITGLPREAIEVHTTQLGGGFGRRLESDYVAEAVEVSMKLGKPVQVVWSREDDMQHDVYRPMSYHRLSGVLNANGDAVGWRHRIVAPSIISRFIPGWLPDFVVHRLPPMRGGIDEGAVEGAFNHAYAIPNQLVDWVKTDTPVPIGFWRSVGYSYNSFVVESFVDELAQAAKQDAFEFRRKLLKDAPRHRGVLELAADKAGWGKPLAPGRFRGIAVAESFRSCVAEVAEVSVEDGQIRVHRVVCAVDCGFAVNPGIVTAQMSGAIIWGLSAALHGEITIQDGRVAQSNFHDYPVARMNETPAIEVHIVPSAQPPTGVGEPGVPPLAPAVANAVFAATGKRIRSLPIRV